MSPPTRDAGTAAASETRCELEASCSGSGRISILAEGRLKRDSTYEKIDGYDVLPIMLKFKRRRRGGFYALNITQIAARCCPIHIHPRLPTKIQIISEFGVRSRTFTCHSLKFTSHSLTESSGRSDFYLPSVSILPPTV